MVVVLGETVEDCGFGEGARDGCGSGWGFEDSFSRSVDRVCPADPFVICERDGIVANCEVLPSLSPLSRLNEGTARTGAGAVEAEALGVF